MICDEIPFGENLVKIGQADHEIICLKELLGSQSYSVRTFCFVATSVVCLFRVRSRKLHKIRAKFRTPYKKSGSESKNIMSDFAPEVAK